MQKIIWAFKKILLVLVAWVVVGTVGVMIFGRSSGFISLISVAVPIFSRGGAWRRVAAALAGFVAGNLTVLAFRTAAKLYVVAKGGFSTPAFYDVISTAVHIAGIGAAVVAPIVSLGVVLLVLWWNRTPLKSSK